MSTPGEGVVAQLERWETSGGTWRVLFSTPGRATVALCRCDGGEEVDRVTSDAPELIAYLAGRESSTD
ncbi:MAG: hypothetical protein GX593_11355 [Actinomycetales bacterium]|nr:hypothetical protein [Actinomycetales bacterium]